MGKSATNDAGGDTESRLRRELGLWGAIAFVISSMVGTGIFTVPAFVRSATGSGGRAIGVWLVGAVLALAGAFCYAELATRFPEAGGEYQYLTRVYGRLWGFVSGWLSFFAGFAAPTAASSIGAVAYFKILFPGWNAEAPVFSGIGITQGSLAAACIVLLMAGVHSLGIYPSGRLQTTLAALSVFSICAFVIAGFATGNGDWNGVISSGVKVKDAGLWWIALIQVSFAYTGWNAAAYLAGEVKEPERVLPRALIGGTLIVVVLYIALNLLFFYALPESTWVPTIAVGQVAAAHLFGTTGSKVLSLIITVIILGSISAWTASGPRVYFAMACDGLAPAVFRRLGRKSTVPVAATWIQATVAAGMALSGGFETLLIYVGAALLLFSGITVTAVYFARGRQLSNGDRHFRIPFYPFTPAIFVLMVAVSWLQSLREQLYPTLASLVTILGGIVIYFISRKLSMISDQE